MDNRFSIEPFLTGESAIAWLSGHLDAAREVDVKSIYAINIITNLILNEKDLFFRLPQKTGGGLRTGQRKNVSASVLLRASEKAAGDASRHIGAPAYTEEQRLIGTWAEKDGCWEDYADSSLLRQGFDYLDRGSEAKVYFAGKRVYKTLEWERFGSIQGLLDRISLHNAAFPNTELRVEGFGMRDDAQDNRGFVAIVSQPYIQSLSKDQSEEAFLRRTDELEENMRARGFEFRLSPLPAFYSTDGTMVFFDLHDDNVMKDIYGNLRVIDCDCKLNTKEGPFGHYEIPALCGDEKAIREIDAMISLLVPKRIDRETFTSKYETEENLLSEQLRETGRFDGYFLEPDGNGGVNRFIVEVDPDNPGILNKLSCDAVGFILSTDGNLTPSEIARLSEGRTIERSGSHIAFSLAKGRVDGAVAFNHKILKGPALKYKEPITKTRMMRR